jgi:hypothetical protein
MRGTYVPNRWILICPITAKSFGDKWPTYAHPAGGEPGGSITATRSRNAPKPVAAINITIDSSILYTAARRVKN